MGVGVGAGVGVGVGEGVGEGVGGGTRLGSIVTVLLPIAVHISKSGCPKAWVLRTLTSKLPLVA